MDYRDVVSHEDNLSAKSCWQTKKETKHAAEGALPLEVLNMYTHCTVQKVA